MSQSRKAREAAAQILYQVEEASGRLPDDPTAGLNRFFENFEHDPQARADAETLVRGVCQAQTAIDEALGRHSTRWKLNRMAKVDRNILRLAAHELMTRTDVPARVVLNDAIELGKKFGSESSSAFINGVLDPVAREARQT